MKSLITLTMLVVFLAFLTSAQGNLFLKEAIRNTFYGLFNGRDVRTHVTDAGYVKSCGPPDANFSVSWEPKVLDPEGSIVVNYTYRVPHDFKQGTADVALYFNKIKNPIFDDTFPLTCKDINKYFHCPFMAGPTVHGSYPYSNLLILKGYDGVYKAKVNVKNQDGKVMICAIAVVEIRGKD